MSAKKYLVFTIFRENAVNSRAHEKAPLKNSTIISSFLFAYTIILILDFLCFPPPPYKTTNDFYGEKNGSTIFLLPPIYNPYFIFLSIMSCTNFKNKHQIFQTTAQSVYSLLECALTIDIYMTYTSKTLLKKKKKKKKCHFCLYHSMAILSHWLYDWGFWGHATPPSPPRDHL